MQNYEHWSYEKDEDNIIWLKLDRADSKVNSLNGAVLAEFDQILDALNKDTSVRAVIIRSGKDTGFILGADISQFKGFHDAQEATQLIRKGQEIFNKLENLAHPTIALIEGYCLGGGLELVLACRYRLAEDSLKTKLGLPEVKLGIHPGWGGSIRLPNLIGVPRAMDVILTGRNFTSKQAKKLGFVDETVPKRLLEKAAKDYVFKPPVRKPLPIWHKVLSFPAIRPFVGKFLKHQLRNKISPLHYPAPFRVVDNWVTFGTERPAAMIKEAESIGELFFSETSKNLVRVFFLQEQLKAKGKGIAFAPKHIHVIGAGVMGGDIAAWCALRGFKVTMQDRVPKLIGNAIKRAYDLAGKQLKEKYLIQDMMDRLIPDPNGYGIKHADIMIEAIPENLKMKQDLFSQLEMDAKPDAILATNTSTIPLEEIGLALKEPERLVGIHFFNPVAKMPLVEVVRGKNTHSEMVKHAIRFVCMIDKLPLPVHSSPGFLVNRILLPYLLESMALLEEGASAPLIDKAATDFGMPMGPIELADAVGLDVCVDSLKKLSGDDAIPALLSGYISRGELGKKTGKGFYNYENGKVIKPKLSSSEVVPEDMTLRLVARLINESVACIREGIVESPDELDAGCIFGFGFPPFRGGPITFIRSEGEGKWKKILETLATRYGKRFIPDKGWQPERMRTKTAKMAQSETQHMPAK